MRRLILAALVGLFMSAACYAQPQTGVYAHGAFDTKTFDTVNIGNLNVYFHVPVYSKPGRGLSFYYNLAYNNSVWWPSSVNGSLSWVPNFNWGWTAETDAHTGYASWGSMSTGTCLYGGHKVAWEVYGNYFYVDTLGVVHHFNGAETSNVPSCTGVASSWTGPASDPSGYVLTAGVDSATVTSRTGAVVTPPYQSVSGGGSTVDSNGNEILINTSGQIEDTTGKVILTVSGTAPNPTTYTYNDTSGTPRSITINYATYTVQTAFGCSGVAEFGPTSENLISSISYPDGSSYSFTYEPTPGVPGNVTGRLASVTLPQGGTIGYSYSGGNNGIECSDGGTATLTRTMPNDPQNSTSTYTRTPGTNSTHTEVVDGLGNFGEYDFVNDPADPNYTPYLINRRQYQGAATGTPLVFDQNCLNQALPDCTGQSLRLPISQIDAYETLDGIEMHGSTTQYGAYGLPTLINSFDFGGASSRGPELSQEQLSYYSVPGLVHQDELFDGSNNEAGNTVYNYDETTPQPSSGIPAHVAVSGPRGNLTSIYQYADASTSYATTMTYEDTGSVLNAVSPDGTTTPSYDPTFVYTTGVSLPTPSSGVAIGTGASYDTTYTGLPLTSTDPNSQVTQIVSYDAMLRPTQQNDPDGGEIIWSYSPTTVTQDSYQSSGVYAQTETQVDGYGRLSRTIVANGQGSNPFYQQDTCYDANGNVNFISYTYQGSGLGSSKVCSGAGTTYAYDALSRLKAVAQSNGEAKIYTYTGRATKSVDENNVTRISQIDGLGRTTIVCEISSNSSMPGSGSPTSCGMDISGTGFVTSYSYSLATGTTTVTEGAQTRTFENDWLGRPVSVTEPESGTTTYAYGYNSYGLQVTRLRPQANQTNPNNMTTTWAQFDSLSRPISITYSDSTPGKYYSYDVAQEWGATLQNPKGHLVAESTTSNTGAIYSYDAMGRVILRNECTPSNCGTGSFQTGYTYDWTGNLTSSTDGFGVQNSYSYSLANEAQSITSSLNDSSDPPNILSNVQNGPFGPVSWQLGNGLSAYRQYDTLGRVNGGWLCQGQPQAYCSGGTQVYGFTGSWTGNRATGACDTALNYCATFGSDEFGRLNQLNITSGSGTSFAYVYDRWGNRWQQNAVGGGGGPQPNLSFNSNNQITNSGYVYDAAGNLMTDGAHSYTYDADGNLTQVDGGNTATYTYDAENQRVRIDNSGNPSVEFIFNPFGQRASVWDATDGWQSQGQTYWGSAPLEFYNNGYAHYQHQDWLGTERMATNNSGQVEGTYTSLPFGDGFSVSGTDDDTYHFARMDYDYNSGYSGTAHAQFRQYENDDGRWMSPDPYSGSYDFINPQSLNRYGYVLNNPFAFVDPSGLISLDTCDEFATQLVWDPYRQVFVTTTYLLCLPSEYPPSETFSFGPQIGHSGGGGRGISAPSKTPCTQTTGYRVTQAILGVTNLSLAYSKTQELGTADGLLALAAPGSGGASAAVAVGITVYGGVSFGGQAISGSGQLYTAISGNARRGEQISQVGDILSGPLTGISTLIGTGNPAQAQQVANIESAITAGAGLVNSRTFNNALDFGLGLLGLTGAGCHP